jgi:hypothetical protein
VNAGNFKYAFSFLVLSLFSVLAQTPFGAGPPGRFWEMEMKADLVFKGQAVSSVVITNAAFTVRADVCETQFKVISVLEGALQTNLVTFQHYASGPRGGWSGRRPPESYHFENRQTYLIFAARLDKPDIFYDPTLNKTTLETNDFRQIYGGGVIRTLDARPLAGLSVKDAHWFELNLLLNDTNPTNQLSAIDQLDRMSLAGRGDDEWSRSDDFKRTAVLSALLPMITNSNERVANRAINCFATAPNSTGTLEPFTDALIKVANESVSSNRRLNAINALSGTSFAAVSNSLAQLLDNPDANVRAGAVGLLSLYPGDFANQALLGHATDKSPMVRATVADVIGNGRIANLLPTLEKLLSDPVGLTNPIPPLTIEDLQEGGHSWGNNNGDVHTSAGYALLKFDTDQISNILIANLNDAGFRPNYLCKLADQNAGPWLTNLVELLEARRDRIWKEVVASGVEPRTNYFQARMALAGTYFQCWNCFVETI